MVAVQCSKAIIVTVNVIFSIFGLALLAVGIIFKIAFDKTKDAIYNENGGSENLVKAGDAFIIGAIVLGTFIALVAVMGCIGACCGVRCMLALYVFLIFILLIAQGSVVGYAATKTSDLNDKFENSLNSTLRGYDEMNVNDSSKAWSDIFYLGDCCGVTDYRYDLSGFIKDTTHRTAAGISTTSNIPIMCCNNVNFDDELTTKLFTDHKECLDSPTKQNARVEGCYSKILDWIHHYRNVLIGVGIAIVLLEIILMVLGAYVYRSIDD